jgi:hypothetical protein
MAAIYQPSACVDAAVNAPVCGGGKAPCFAKTVVHPTIGLWQSLPTPNATAYIADLVTCKKDFGTVGFSVYRADGVASRSQWGDLGAAIVSDGIAVY